MTAGGIMSVYGGLVPLGFDPFHSCDNKRNYVSDVIIARIPPLDKGGAVVYDETTISYAASCFASRLPHGAGAEIRKSG